jgi:hypothetical protein
MTAMGSPEPPCESVFRDRTIFVVGTRRSGTTWLSELLLAHPDVGGPGTFESLGDVVPMESLIFGALADVWVNAHRPDEDGIGVLMGQKAVYAAMRQFCDRVFEGARDRYSQGATWYLDKSPDNVDRVPILAEVYPDAWYVHIYRDGRDVTRSLLAAPFDDIRSAGDGAASWLRGVGSVLREKWRLSRLYEISYEQLLADPVGETVRIFEWIGLPVTDELLDEIGGKSGRQVAKLGSTGPPRLGKWRDMDPDDLAAAYDVGGDLLAELGYIDESDLST